MEQWATCWIHAPKLEQNKQKKERETEVAAYYQSTRYLLLSVAAFSKSATLAVQLAVRLGLFFFFFFMGGVIRMESTLINDIVWLGSQMTSPGW